MADLYAEIFSTLLTMIAVGAMAIVAFKFAQLQADRILKNEKEKSTMQVGQLVIELESTNATLGNYIQRNEMLQDKVEHLQVELEQRDAFIEEIETRLKMMEELSVQSRDLYSRIMQISGMLSQLMNVVVSLKAEKREESEAE